MPEAEVSTNEFYEAFNQSLGTEGAKKIVQEAILEAGLTLQASYPISEALMICDTLRKKPGFIRIVGSCLSARFTLKKV
jgi:hypothetical protein